MSALNLLRGPARPYKTQPAQQAGLPCLGATHKGDSSRNISGHLISAGGVQQAAKAVQIAEAPSWAFMASDRASTYRRHGCQQEASHLTVLMCPKCGLLSGLLQHACSHLCCPRLLCATSRCPSRVRGKERRLQHLRNSVQDAALPCLLACSYPTAQLPCRKSWLASLHLCMQLPHSAGLAHAG